MTRWARGGNANKKKLNEASSWEQMKQEMGKQSQRPDKLQKKKKNQNHAHNGNKLITSLVPPTKSKAHKKHKLEEHVTNEHKRKKNRVGSDPAKTSEHNDVPLNTSGTTKVDKKKVKAHSIFTDPSSSSGKSIVDILLEANKIPAPNKESGASGEGDITEGQITLEVFQKKEKRREERRLKRQSKKADNMVCFHCRQPGHGVADCPQMVGDVEQGTGICFRCGSTEHDVSKCHAKADKKLGEFPYAKCFICQQTGHLSRMCPDNPRGLYPEGGGCKECGSVEHRWWNCPVRKPVKGVDVSVTPHALTFNKRTHVSADAEPAFMKRSRVKEKKSGPKVVVF